MLKLLKYDFRRSRDQILGLFVVTLLLQVGTWISAAMDMEDLLVLNVVVYSIAGCILVYTAIRTFERNTRVYHRRLLPVKPLQSVLSPLLLCWLLLLGMTVMALAHFGLYNWAYPDAFDFLPEHLWPIAAGVLLQILWSVTSVMILVMFSITAARCFRVRGRMWIGLIIFVVMDNLLSFVMRLIFGGQSNFIDNTFQTGIVINRNVPGNLTLSQVEITWGPALLQLIIAAVLIYLITLLSTKKIEC